MFNLPHYLTGREETTGQAPYRKDTGAESRRSFPAWPVTHETGQARKGGSMNDPKIANYGSLPNSAGCRRWLSGA